MFLHRATIAVDREMAFEMSKSRGFNTLAQAGPLAQANKWALAYEFIHLNGLDRFYWDSGTGAGGCVPVEKKKKKKKKKKGWLAQNQTIVLRRPKYSQGMSVASSNHDQPKRE